MPISTIKLIAIFNSSQENKKENWISIPDSKEGTIYPNVIGSSGGETHNGWKVHISIDPNKIIDAATLITEILNDKNAPKVSIKFASMHLAKNGQPSKQVAFTFYQDELIQTDKIATFLNSIEAALTSAGIGRDSRQINSDAEICKTKFDACMLNTEGKPTRFNYRNDQCIVMEDELYLDCGGRGNITQVSEQIWIKQSYYLNLEDIQKHNPAQIPDPFSKIRITITKDVTKEETFTKDKTSASSIIIKRNESPVFSTNPKKDSLAPSDGLNQENSSEKAIGKTQLYK